jgi:dTDP-glucose pyrophosphorylase
LNPEPNFSTIILCGGKKRVPTSIETSVSNAMTPINGKPVIGWILDDLIQKQIGTVTIVLREEDEKFKAFLQRAFAQRMNLTPAPISGSGTILHSLLAGLSVGRDDERVRVILGDTLIRDSFEGDEDFVYVGSVEESKRWCLPVVTDDGVVVEYIDKKNLSGGPFKAIAGYYHLLDRQLLERCVRQAIADGKRELSDALLLYGRQRPLRVREVREWYDFGHIDKIVEARRRLLQPRYFNALSVNPVLNTITKVSRSDEKLHDELNWYKNLPPHLQVLAPRILSHEQVNGHLHLVQEYYGYPTLAELYVYGDLDAETWFSIVRNVLKIHNEFRRYTGTMDAAVVRDFYFGKVQARLEALSNQSPEWSVRLSYPTICWNGRKLQNLSALLPTISKKAEHLARTAEICIIHGDLCFSNILYDVNNQIIRLIDPRGRFGVPGIYGDPRYDVAKLRHSIAGLYDYVTADMFALHEHGNEFESEIFANGVEQEVAQRFDRMLRQAGYDLEEVKFIEGLLFISMLPLHADHPRRQTMMYLRGLELLNGQQL